MRPEGFLNRQLSFVLLLMFLVPGACSYESVHNGGDVADFHEFLQGVRTAGFADVKNGNRVPDLKVEEFEEAKLSLQQKYEGRTHVTQVNVNGAPVDCFSTSTQPHLQETGGKIFAPENKRFSEEEVIKLEESAKTSKADKSEDYRKDVCPEETVGIARNDLAREIHQNRVLKTFQKRTRLVEGAQEKAALDWNPNEVHKYAVGRIWQGPYSGGAASWGVWNPSTKQQSIAQLWIGGYDSGTVKFQSLEVGWVVNTQVHPDGKARPFFFFTPDAYRSGCFNFNCYGGIKTNPFVQTDHTFTFDTPWPLGQYSTPGAEKFISFSWRFQDNKWVLLYKCDPSYSETCSGQWNQIGYIPASFYSSRSTFAAGLADSVQFGGEVSTTILPETQQMGAGVFAEAADASTFKDVIYFDAQGNEHPAPLVPFMPDNKCYTIDVQTGASTSFSYGGPQCVWGESSPWENGNFCMPAQKSGCPAGFQDSWVRWSTTRFDNKDGMSNPTELQVTHQGAHHDCIDRHNCGLFPGEFTQHFCCRKQQDDFNPYWAQSEKVCVVQYTSGKCPDSSMEQSFIVSDTEDSHNADSYSGVYPRSVPEHRNKQGRIQLQYCCANRSIQSRWWESQDAKDWGFCVMRSMNNSNCNFFGEEGGVFYDTSDESNEDAREGIISLDSWGAHHGGMKFNFCCMKGAKSE